MTEEIAMQEQDEMILQPVEISKAQARRRFSRVGFALLAMVVIQQGIATALLAVIGNTPSLAGYSWLPILANFLPLYLIALPVFVLILRGQQALAPAAERRRVDGKVIVQSAFAGYALTIACNVVIGLGLYSIIAALKGGGEMANPVADLVTKGNPLATLPFMVLGAPLLEEYVFRGVLLKHLGGFGAKPYMLFSALAFSLFHANLAQCVYAFLLGLIFAGLTYYSGTIKYSVITHLIVNFMGGALPSLLLRLGKNGEAIFGLLAAVGVIIGIVSLIQLRRKKMNFSFEPAAAALPKGAMLGNAGVILFIIVMAALTLTVLAF